MSEQSIKEIVMKSQENGAKPLVENENYILWYRPEMVNRFIVYTKASAAYFVQAVAQSPNFTKKLKSYFTPQQVNTALAKIHAIKHVSKRFKA